MKFRLLFLLLFFSLSSFNAGHKFYVSVTEMEYNEKTQSLQIISRIFIDDLEDVLRQRYDDSIRLSAKAENEEVAGYIEKYLGQRMHIRLDGKSYKMNYLGNEYENDMALLYIEVPDIPSFKKITVKNAVLTDLFGDQKNLIHVEYQGKTKSLILTRNREVDHLNF